MEQILIDRCQNIFQILGKRKISVLGSTGPKQGSVYKMARVWMLIYVGKCSAGGKSTWSILIRSSVQKQRLPSLLEMDEKFQIISEINQR